MPARTQSAAAVRPSPIARATVIVYHGVGDCPPRADPYHLILPTAEFAWQMAFLARHRRVVPLAALVDESARAEGWVDTEDSRPAVAITFDDGYRSLLTTALPILERYGFPAAAFVPTRWIGDRNRWDPPRPGASPLEIMDPGELRECALRGLEVGSHGHGHLHLTRLRTTEAEADLTASHVCLAEILGHAPQFVAYPWGEHSASVRVAAMRAGFVAGFSINQLANGSFRRQRVGIRRSDTRSTFRVKTSGYYLRLRMSPLPRVGLRLLEPALQHYRNGR